MQANGGTPAEATSASDTICNDQLPDLASGNSQVATTTNGSPSTNQVPQQQQRSPSSPGQQQPHHPHPSPQQHQSGLTGSMTSSGSIAPSQMESNVHHHVSQRHQQSGGGGYRQRHGQSYHNQQHIQQYHHQQNKYNNSKSDNESNVNHVLLITVINPHYPITCDLIHQICNTYGKVNRIVIFKKNGIQAMVEFDNVESAKRAKAMLYGCDIYSGCCTLRIEYAKPTRLNVHKNDNESFDYTNPNLGSGCGSEAGSGQDDQHNHQAQHQHHLQGSTAPPHHSNYHHSGGHHSRGTPGANRRGGGDGAGANGAHNHHQAPQFHPPQQHLPTNPHIKQQPPASTSQHSASGYGMGQPPMDHTSDSFQQDGGFNVSRGGPTSSYVGVDPFLPTHGGPHGIHGSMYSRQDSHHSQHHHHHSRGPLGNAGGGGSNPHHNSFPSANATNALMAGPSNLAPQGTVMMVYGLNPERVNCDRLFNLFCLYGNVVRVKFLRTKEGCAMVQMGDVLAVDRCVSSLNKIILFGNELQISYSKQAFLHDVILPFILPDGSPSFKDFMGNKNNRFKNPEVASKNRILPPSQVLHFFNAPFGITEDELVHLFKQTAGHEPVSLKIFAPKAETTKSFSGLVTFRDPAEATEALVLCNHLSMPKAGAPHPYILRLCFSPPTYVRPPPLNFAPGTVS